MHLARLGRLGRLLFRDRRHGQHDTAVDGIHLQHAHHQVHRFPREVGRVRDRAFGVELAHRDEALDVVTEIDDHALVHQADDRARKLGADRIRLTDAKPRIFLGLLEAERDTLVFAVDVEDDHVHGVALLHDFRRMLDALGPGHIGDVNEAVDAGLDFDERAERGQVANLAVDTRANRVLERQDYPRILLGLLHTQ